MTKKEVKKLWASLREQCKKRDGDKCFRCGKTHNKKGRKLALHLSHIYPRGLFPSMTYLLDNVKLLCYSCHIMWWHKHPVGAYKWYVGAIKPARRARLQRYAKQKTRTSKST